MKEAGFWLFTGPLHGDVVLHHESGFLVAEHLLRRHSISNTKLIGAWEGHLSCDFKRCLWVSIDGNFWFGGKTTVSSIEKSLTCQTSSRLGATLAVPAASPGSIHGWDGQTKFATLPRCKSILNC